MTLRPFAVTLHPLDEDDYVRRTVAVAAGRLAPSALAAPVAHDPIALALAVRAVPKMREALTALRASDGVPWSTAVNFSAGLLSAWRHPAWYLGDMGLSYGRGGMQHPLRGYAHSMAVLAARSPELGAAAAEVREGFSGPRSAGSFLAAGDVLVLLRDLERRPLWFVEQFTAQGYSPREVIAPLLEALHYCRTRRLALLELTDAVDPAARTAFFPDDHLRGGWRGGLHPEVLRRVDEMLAV